MDQDKPDDTESQTAHSDAANEPEAAENADRESPLGGPNAPPKICPNCMAANEESTHLCRICFMPLSAHATIDPIYGISARGDTFSKAANAPRKPIVLIGMWLIFGPMAIALMFIFSLLLRLNASPLALLLVAAFMFIPVMILIKTTTNFLGRPAWTPADQPDPQDDGNTQPDDDENDEPAEESDEHHDEEETEPPAAN